MSILLTVMIISIIYIMNTQEEINFYRSLMILCSFVLLIGIILGIVYKERIFGLFFIILFVILIGNYLILDIHLIVEMNKNFLNSNDYIIGTCSLYIDIFKIYQFKDFVNVIKK